MAIVARLVHVLIVSVSLLSGGCASLGLPGESKQKPNILWITAEDMSPVMGSYGDAYAITPNLDRLATRSVRYTNAFASAPICSPSRTCLINGIFATSQGTHQMRSAFPIPSSMNGFPTLLRKAGYYTTNNVKTDYNSGNGKQIIASSWDDSSATAHWRNRSNKGQPFFSIINLMTSHQSRSMVWPYEKFKADVQSKLKSGEIHDPAKAPLPPYYPDTPVVRKTYARFYDCVTAMDKQVGAILEQLKADGLAENTIVFFYGDHGNGMPRHKRALFDSGMKVPLLVHFPKKYAHLAPVAGGKTSDRLTSFVDYGPTVLSLAGVKIPAHMEGKPFLGAKTTSPRTYVYGHRDRCDEAIDMARSVRDKQYLYIRNYMPHLGYGQVSAWTDQGEIQHEFYRAFKLGKMNDAQAQYAGPTRPREELYDCKADPMNLKNLAASSTHRKTLGRLRSAHQAWVIQSKDLGFMPEIEQWKIAKKQPAYAWAQKSGNYNVQKLMAAAGAVGRQDEALFIRNLLDPDPSVRYWAAVGLNAMAKPSDKTRAALSKATLDPSAAVRIEAASALGKHSDDPSEALKVLLKDLQHEDVTVQIYAARAIELMGAKAKAAKPAMAALNKKYKGQGDPHMFVYFATEGFLNRLSGKWSSGSD
jgi:N-sulfoglucosamine sulfohydrolase